MVARNCVLQRAMDDESLRDGWGCEDRKGHQRVDATVACKGLAARFAEWAWTRRSHFRQHTTINGFLTVGFWSSALLQMLKIARENEE